jgi:hypothetical protein
MTEAEVSEGLGLDTLKGRQWAIHKACAIKGEGLEEGLDWWVLPWSFAWSIDLHWQAGDRNTKQVSALTRKVLEATGWLVPPFSIYAWRSCRRWVCIDTRAICMPSAFRRICLDLHSVGVILSAGSQPTC